MPEDLTGAEELRWDDWLLACAEAAAAGEDPRETQSDLITEMDGLHRRRALTMRAGAAAAVAAAALDAGRAENAKTPLWDAVLAWHEAWAPRPWEQGAPSFTLRSSGDPVEALENVFADVARQHEGLKPALAAVTRLVGHLLPDARRRRTLKRKRVTEARLPLNFGAVGSMATLRVEQWRGAFATVAPDPLRAGFLITSVAFERGATQVWEWTTPWHRPRRPTHVFWSLEVADDQLPRDQVEGRSAEAALALAMLHCLHRSRPVLDPKWAITGALAEDAGRRGTLEGVSGYERKLEAVEQAGLSLIVPEADLDQPAVTRSHLGDRGDLVGAVDVEEASVVAGARPRWRVAVVVTSLVVGSMLVLTGLTGGIDQIADVEGSSFRLIASLAALLFLGPAIYAETRYRAPTQGEGPFLVTFLLVDTSFVVALLFAAGAFLLMGLTGGIDNTIDIEGTKGRVVAFLLGLILAAVAGALRTGAHRRIAPAMDRPLTVTLLVLAGVFLFMGVTGGIFETIDIESPAGRVVAVLLGLSFGGATGLARARARR